MNEKAKRHSGNLAEIIIVLAILVFVNLLGYNYFKRFDFTESKQYTVSAATKSVLKRLDDPVSVVFYQSKDLPPQLMAVRNEIRDKLEEYEAYSGGNFNVRYIDPGDDLELIDKALSQGVPEFEVQVIQKEERMTKKVFCGLSMSYEDKTEAIPVAIDPTNLEYELTSRLFKLTLESKPKIGFFAGDFKTNEQQQSPTYQGLHQLLGGQDGLYEVEDINSASDKKLPDGLDGLIISGAFGMSDSLKYSLDQFLLDGGQVMVAVDPMMRISQGQGGGPEQAYPSIPTIEDQLEKYGIRFDKRLIADPSCGKRQVQTFLGPLPMSYYLWPNIRPSGFNQNVAAVARLESLVTPWACPLQITGAEGLKFSSIAKTTEASFLLSSPFDLGMDQQWDFLQTSSESQGPYDVAFLIEGTFPSGFPEGPPSKPAAPEGLDTITLAQEFDPDKHRNKGNGNGRLVVISSGLLFSDSFLRANVTFLENLVDMMLLGNELLEIRSTPVTSRPLKQLSDIQKNTTRWALVLGVPIVLVLGGILLWFLKGRKRRAIQARYGG